MKEFWEYKARKYPNPFDENVLQETLKVIRDIESFGFIFDNKKIIDIGCGTGIYGLVFSKFKNARKVVCLDFSNKMIERLQEQIKFFELKNVDVFLSSFIDFPADKYYKYFDISFASMTPAISNESDILKMEMLSNNFCVYVGWVEKKYDNIFDELYRFLGIDYKTPKGFYDIREILDKLQRNYKSFLFETSWEWKGSYDDVIDEISIKHKDILLNKGLIRDFLSHKFPDSEVRTVIHATEGVLIWKV